MKIASNMCHSTKQPVSKLVPQHQSHCPTTWTAVPPLRHMLHSAECALNRFLPMEISVCEKFCTLPIKIHINSSLLLRMSALCTVEHQRASDNTKTKLFSSPTAKKKSSFASQKFKLLNRWIAEEDIFHPKIKSNNEKQNQPWESSLMCSHTHHRATAVWSRGKKRASSRTSQR